jgi:hypothetical protein
VEVIKRNVQLLTSNPFGQQAEALVPKVRLASARPIDISSNRPYLKLPKGIPSEVSIFWDIPRLLKAMKFFRRFMGRGFWPLCGNTISLFSTFYQVLQEDTHHILVLFLTHYRRFGQSQHIYSLPEVLGSSLSLISEDSPLLANVRPCVPRRTVPRDKSLVLEL